VLKKLKKVFDENRYDSLMINLGKTYMSALQGFEELVSPMTSVKILEGNMGPRKRDLRNWLLSVS